MWVFANYVTVAKPTNADLMWIIPISVILLVVLSYLVFKLLDFPIRTYLTQKLKGNAKPGNS